MVGTWKYEDAGNTILKSVSTTEESIQIPKQVQKIVDGNSSFSPFFDCRRTAKFLSFADGSDVTYIGLYCFAQMESLVTADLSTCLKLKEINKGLFSRSSLVNIILPELGILEILHAGSFYASKITKIKIPSTVVKIGTHESQYGGVFSDCLDLLTIEILPDSKLSTIGYAIAQNSGVESFFIPKLVTSFSSGALNRALSLKSITVDVDHPTLISIDEIVYSKDRTTLICCACNKQTPIQVIPGISSISGEAFRGCRIQTPFVIPEGIIQIYTNTFNSALFSQITIASTVKILKYYSFTSVSLKSITIPPSVELIENNAFLNTFLKTIIILPRNESLHLADFSFENCRYLTSIELPTKNVIINSSKVFYNCVNLKNVYYQMPDFPLRTDSFGSAIRFYARIFSQSTKQLPCGDVEIEADLEQCRIIRRCSYQHNAYFIKGIIIFLNYHILFTYH